MQQKKYENPKIAMLNVELELKAERENAEVRVDNVQVSQIEMFLDIITMKKIALKQAHGGVTSV